MSRRVLAVVTAGIGVSILAFYLGKKYTDAPSEAQKMREDQQESGKCEAGNLILLIYFMVPV